MGVFQMSEARVKVSYVVLPVEEKSRTEDAASRREKKMHKIKMSHAVTRLINCQYTFLTTQHIGAVDRIPLLTTEFSDVKDIKIICAVRAHLQSVGRRLCKTSH